MNDLVLALDFGGTKLSTALFMASTSATTPSANSTGVTHLSAEMLALERYVSPPGDPNAHALEDLVMMLSAAHALLAGRTPAAVGVSFGGPVDFAAGVVRLSHHVPGWEGYPLREELARHFGTPVAVDNDANVAALGEHRFGAGRGVDDLLYVTVSTGVGGGWVLGGRPWRGAGGMAGEIGHTVVDPSGPRCLCGKRGCVERLASGPYMAADYVAQVSGRAGQQGGGRAGEPEHRERSRLTGKDVAEAAAAGDETARAILLRGARALGVGLGNAANLVNPQRIILGGGVTKAGEAWWEEVRRAARQTALPEVTFDVVPAALGDDAPLWGAVALVM